MKFNEKLKIARKEAKITQVELAESSMSHKGQSPIGNVACENQILKPFKELRPH